MKKDITKVKPQKKLLNFIKRKWYLFIFIIIIYFPLIQMNLNIFDADVLNEKREKAEKPVFSKDSDILTYLANYETYFNDNFGFRENFIKLANTIDVKVFNKASNSNVVLGKNDYLYSSEELNDYNKTNTLSEADMEIILGKLKYFQERLAERGIDFVFTVAPNKSTIYPEFMPYERINEAGQSNLDKLNNLIDDYSINYINYKNLMLDNKGNYDLYYKRDTHWNTVAAALASNELLSYFSTKYNTDFGSITPTNIREEHITGDLDDLLGITTSILETTCDTEINTTDNILPKTLIYMDSFFYDVSPTMNNFFVQKLDMHNLNAPVHSNFSLYSPNSKIVIFEIVERYIPQLLEYDFNMFDEYMDELDISVSETKLDFNSALFNNVANFSTESPFILSSLSSDSSIVFDTYVDTLDYIYLDLNNLDQYKTISFYWAKEDEEFTDENSIPILLRSGKTKYQIVINKNNIDISKVKLQFDTKENLDLNINSISLYTKE